MKKKLLFVFSGLIATLSFIILATGTTKAQIINENFEEADWKTLNGTSGQVVLPAKTTTSTVSYLTASTSFTTALNTNDNAGTWWYSKATSQSNNKLDKIHSLTSSVKLSSSGYVVTPITKSAIVSVTFWAQLATPMTVGILTDTKAGQPSYSSSYPIPANFSNFSTSFPANNVMTSYSINFTGITAPVRIGFFNFGGSSSYIDDIVVMPPVGTPPTVTTDNVAPAITSAEVTGTVTKGTLPLLASGIIWSTSPLTGNVADTALATKTWKTPSSITTFTDKIGPLTASTVYYTNAYVIALDGTVYFGIPKQFTTNPLSKPSVNIKLNNVYSYKVDATGFNIDSGGVYVSEKGFVYNTVGNPQIGAAGSTQVKFATSGVADFTDLIKNLKANTNYCFKAYAKNSIGIGYSKDTCIKTGAVAPYLTAVPGAIDFGENFFGSDPITVSYILTGANLTPGSGAITVTCPAPFKISLQPGTGFSNSLSINYFSGKLTSTPIYVQLPTSAYGTWGYSSILNITHSGGGVAAVDADAVKLSGSITQAPDDISNRGSDFLLGFGYQEKMSRKAGDADECKLSLYVTTGDQPATVHVDLNSGGYSQTATIPANSYKEFTGFPMGDASDPTNPNNLPDTRLFSTGISKKSIHVYTDNNVPVSVFSHSYTKGNTAAGAMIFPTNTWNSSYTVQAFGGTSNNSNPNSFFFVIANEDNTVITFKPTQPILDATAASLFNENQTTAGNTLYAANGTYTVTLNKGEVFNAIGGFNPSGNGLDLSGSTVATSCDKKITVFGGNGRCLVPGINNCTSGTGSDHLIQQMFPSVAWGTKYLTAPTQGQTTNYFRIYVQDPTSLPVVKVNGTTLGAGALVNNLYYQYQTNAPAVITSDKPVNVSQFMLTPDCSPGAVDGGPEMIILSPVEQAIKSVVLYSPTSGTKILSGGGSGYTSYINVIIPTSKASTFKLDGVAPNPALFKSHPGDATYSYATLTVTSKSQHKLSADTGFVSIAYGLGDGESYGYNAGTLIKNLQSIKFTDNPNGGDTSNTVVRTCKENPVTLKIALPYNPSLVDSIQWVAGSDPRISPNGTLKGAIDAGTGKAKFEGTVTGSDGRTFYIYSSPVKYQFSDLAVYKFNAIAYGKFKSDCPGQDRQQMVVVVGRDNAYFDTKAACGSPTVTFDNFTTAMANTEIKSWLWEFGDGQTSTSATPGTHTYTNTTGTVYNVKLTTVNSIGCYSYYESQVDFGGGLKANFTKDPTTNICQNSSYKFTDNTTASGTSGTPNKWEWDFGDGSPKITEASPTEHTHTYTTPGKFAVKLTVTTDQNCSDIFIDSVTVEATPVAKFSATTPCKGDVTTFTDLSTIAIGTLGTRTWDFGDGSAPYPDNGTSVTHTYADSGTYTVKLNLLSSGGCPSAEYVGTVKVLALPKDSFDIDVNCTTKEVTFTDKSLTYGQTITEWNWVFDGVGEKHTNGNPFKKTFNDALEHTVSLTVKTTNGCTNSIGFERKFTISVSPVADFDIPAKVCLPNDAAIFTNKTTINDPLNTNAINEIEYKWEFGDNSVQNQLAPAPSTMSHTYAGVGPFTVKLTATSGKGCTNSITKTINTIFAQPKATFTAPAEVCLKESASFASTASAAASSVAKWYWDFGTGSFVGSSTKDTAQSWTVAGTKAIRHYVESAVGCISDTASKSVVVNPLPIASFEQKTVSCAGKEVEFTDKSDFVTAGTTLTQWVWDYGDGTKETKTNNTNLKHTYAIGGTYTVKLVVKNSKGCVSDTFRLAVNVYPNPVANFDLPGNICLPNAVGTFKNTTTITDGTANQISYVWNFGDGTPDQSVAAPSPANINHTYTAVGPFTIKLTATSNQGCIGETTKTLSTIFAQPKASFDAPTEVCLNDDASFSSTSTAASSTISRWFWDLGTGSFTEGKKDTTESWAVSGDKTILHYAISAVGCYSDTATKTVTVNPLPVASLELKSSSCAGKDVEFTDKSDAVTATATLTQWFLDYGDGSTEILNNNLAIKHTYAVGGSYTVKLVVKNSKGCSSDTFRLPIFVYPNPVPGFKVSDICLPLVNAQFTDTSKISSGSIVKWTWDFGDGSAAGTDQNPLHVYAIGNQYNVTLTVESDHGCSTTGSPVAIYAYNAPTAGDSVVLANNLCSNLPVKLVNTSAVNGYGSVTKLEVYWDYANNPSLKTTDNAPVVGTTYEYKYPEFGTPLTKTYQVVVRAYTNSGCFDDSVQTITLHASPKVVFNAIPGVCQEADTVLLNQAYDQYALAPNIGYYSGTGVLDGTNRFVPALAGPGTHVIRYDDTTAIGCVSSATQSIVVYPTPTIKMAPMKAILEGDSYTLNPTVTGIIQSYLWSPTTYMLSSNTIINPVVKPEKDITYTLTVTTTNGCEADSSILIKVLKDFQVPNTFTPNNDGINDHWKIKELPDYPIHRVQIFNRYGQIVYETKAYPARGWDGNYNGKSLPIGTYYYIIEMNGVVNPKVGYVTILK